jgi:hypothetical protein
MRIFELKDTITTPHVILDAEKGYIKIDGRSIPENVIDFYQPILNWIDNYIKEPNNLTIVDFKLEYFNTSSSKRLFDIMRKVESISTIPGKRVVLNWYYEEDD